jgi:hypothetical protein
MRIVTAQHPPGIQTRTYFFIGRIKNKFKSRQNKKINAHK